MMTILLGLLAAMLLGGALAWLGWRGQRINNHPTCRQCRFDLSGTPEPHVTCPECGCGLKRPGWILPGQRRRMPIVLTIGALLAIVPAASFFAAAGAAATGVDLDRHKPLGFLLWEVRGTGDAPRRERLSNELLRRANASAIGADDWRRVVDAVLEMQADTTRPWSDAMGEVYELARVASATTEDDEARFLRQCIVVKWTIRPRVHAGDTIPIRGDVIERRIGQSSEISVGIHAVDRLIDGEPPTSRVRMPERSTYADFGRELMAGAMQAQTNVGWAMLYGSKHQFATIREPGSFASLMLSSDSLEPGEHQVNFNWGLVATRSGRVATRLTPAEQTRAIDASKKPVAMTVQIKAEPTVTTTEATAERIEQVQREMRVERVLISRQPASEYLAMQVSLPKPPTIHLAYDVFVRVNKREISLGQLVSGTAIRTHRMLAYESPQDDSRRSSFHLSTRVTLQGSSKTVTIVFKSSPAAAALTTDQFEYLDGEIVYPDVPVHSD